MGELCRRIKVENVEAVDAKTEREYRRRLMEFIYSKEEKEEEAAQIDSKENIETNSNTNTGQNEKHCGSKRSS